MYVCVCVCVCASVCVCVCVWLGLLLLERAIVELSVVLNSKHASVQ